LDEQQAVTALRRPNATLPPRS